MNCFVFVLLLLTFSGSFVNPSFLVAQEKHTGDCLDNSHCIGFAALLHNSSEYIVSHSVLEFYPGLYSVETTSLVTGKYQIEINGLDNVTISTIMNSDFSTSRAKVKCNEDFKVTLSIKYSTNIEVRNLEMIECSVSLIVPNNIKKCVYNTQDRKFTTSIQAIQTTNLTFNDVHAYSVNQSVLLCIDTRETLCVLNSVFQGSIEICYSNSLFPNKRLIKIHIIDSIIFSGIYYYKFVNQLQNVHSGVILHFQNRLVVEIAINNCTLQGSETIFGYLLQVASNQPSKCPIFTLFTNNTKFLNGGVLIKGCSTSTVARHLQKVHLNNCTVTKTPKDTGFHLRSVPFEIINTVFLGSEEGLAITSGSSGRIINCTFAYCKNALYVTDSNAIIQGKVYFSNNFQGEFGFSAMLLENSFVSFEGYIVVENTRGGKHAAVISSNTTLNFNGEIKFIRNDGFYGGALSLYSYSTMHLYNKAALFFLYNHAWKSGGAIYVETESYRSPHRPSFYSVVPEQRYQCFFYRPRKSNGSMYLCNNTSIEGGFSIYGGSINRCYLQFTSKNYIRKPAKLFTYIARFCKNTESRSKISSLPYYLCFCDHLNYTCSQIEKNVSIVPGQTIEVFIVAVGQLHGTTLATAQAWLMTPYRERLNTNHPYILQSQARKLLGLSCTQVQYTIHAPIGTETLALATKELAEEDVRSSMAEFKEYNYERDKIQFTNEVPLLVHITLLPCMLGYIYITETLSCECHPYISNTEIQCILNNQTIIRSGTIWVNATNETFIMHKHCPLGYCRTEPTEFSLTDPSEQCSFSRTGTLCGQCKETYSQMLGSFDCQECPNLWVLLIVPLILVSGVLLVIFLVTLNLTVAIGTINGLIFYSNILRANNAIFFSVKTSTMTKICDIFIAWVNLDLGFEVCFHRGLDAYIKTLYQLAFPLYICTLVVIIIVSSHYSTRAARLSGTNAVQVLATLFLLSYSKSIRLVITALSPTVLTVQYYPNHTSSTKLVWLYDGNVDYLQGKHILLFLIGIFILVAVSFPFTAILTFIQCLQKKSHHKWLSWVWKMKPLFDAYTGPYMQEQASLLDWTLAATQSDPSTDFLIQLGWRSCHQLAGYYHTDATHLDLPSNSW